MDHLSFTCLRLRLSLATAQNLLRHKALASRLRLMQLWVMKRVIIEQISEITLVDCLTADLIGYST